MKKNAVRMSKPAGRFTGYTLKRYRRDERLGPAITIAVRLELKEHEDSRQVITSLEEELRTIVK